MGCGGSKHSVATDNIISRKNSKAGSKREMSSDSVEETRKVDHKTSSEGGSDAIATSISRKNSSVRSRKGKSSEIVEETRKDDGKTSSPDQPKGENDNSSAAQGAGVEGKKIGESTELKEKDNVKDKTMGEERKEETVEVIKAAAEETNKDQKLDEDSKTETVKDQKAVEETANGKHETVKKEEESKPANGTTKAEVSTAVEKQEEKSDGSSTAGDLKKDQ
ncbi:vicilin-like seed storage protein At2g18540 [Hibiscus syriacus]|uniref:vicilin-like seed storage protein At2g18540 n=1 Tax=Hibiscus syriacus TaxID=106335 RepID=UPI001922D7A6|nr:vicilin-like seed storage protein At2g18540 [Hibiscus syriacus]